MEFLSTKSKLYFPMSEINCWNNDFLALSTVSTSKLVTLPNDSHFTLMVASVTALNCLKK